MIEETKNFIIRCLNLEDMKACDIDDEEPLFNEGLGLDSVDALELGLGISKTYGITLDPKSSDLKEIFKNAKNLNEFIEKNRKDR
ncbi:phosphopantetheine-binding protein [uncultured Campylobacter sp.]|uniref:phosphopantetheine-binding protein n=1 Tax=uncultured Campylobacter sp. TaxID=218934 RepID=UPI0026255FEE|nr:phosphopantetheine-binding protein [uncultured Campylobacter sp.]